LRAINSNREVLFLRRYNDLSFSRKFLLSSSTLYQYSWPSSTAFEQRAHVDQCILSISFKSHYNTHGSNEKRINKFQKLHTDITSYSSMSISPLTREWNFRNPLSLKEYRIMVSKPVRLRLFIASPGEIADQYTKPRSFPSIFSRNGVSKRIFHLKNTLASLYSFFKIRSILKKVFKEKFSRKIFLDEMKEIYINVAQAIAEGNLSKLKHLVTEKYLTELKPLATKAKSGLKSVWNIQSILPTIETVRYVHLKGSSMKFAQITVEFDTRQSFAIYDSKGVLKAGSENSLDIKDYCVFERSLKEGSTMRWRMCAKIVPKE